MPSATNVLGAKACAESGASVAPPALVNAVIDALGDRVDPDAVQMPVRPADVWGALHAR